MEVHFTPETEAKLAQVAAENRTGAAEYVEQLVELLEVTNVVDQAELFTDAKAASAETRGASAGR